MYTLGFKSRTSSANQCTHFVDDRALLCSLTLPALDRDVPYKPDLPGLDRLGHFDLTALSRLPLLYSEQARNLLPAPVLNTP